MKTIKRMAPVNFFVPITRIDEERRIVEGIAFGNEVVEGEGGIRLKASAMQDATADYMKFGTIRAMHQPIAAGTATPTDPNIAKDCGVVWEEIDGKQVARLSSYISDDAEWKKCLDGTYKGYSVGVAPRVMRGKNVESCVWYETSLVDRPKDPDALFTTVRVDGQPEEVDVEIERVSFAEYLEGWGPSDLRAMALDYLWNSLWDIQNTTEDPAERETQVRETCDQFKEFMVGVIATGNLPNIIDADGDGAERAALPTITRSMIEPFLAETDEIIVTRAAWTTAEQVAAEIPDLQRRITEADTTISTLTIERDETKTELERVQGLATAARARVTELEAQPTRLPPVRVPEALERTLAAQEDLQRQTQEINAITRSLQDIDALPPTSDQTEANRRMMEISRLKRKQRELQSA